MGNYINLDLSMAKKFYTEKEFDDLKSEVVKSYKMVAEDRKSVV